MPIRRILLLSLFLTSVLFGQHIPHLNMDSRGSFVSPETSPTTAPTMQSTTESTSAGLASVGSLASTSSDPVYRGLSNQSPATNYARAPQGMNMFDDIDLSEGRLIFSETDVALPAVKGLGLNVSRVYDSSRYNEAGGMSFPEFNGWALSAPKQGQHQYFNADGGGIVVLDINLDGKQDIIELQQENRNGYDVDRLFMSIGWGLDREGNTDSWSPIIEIPLGGGRDNSHNKRGADITSADLDGNGRPEIIVYYIDNHHHYGHYKIGWNMSPSGRISSWSSGIQLPHFMNTEQHGGGITATDINRNGRPDLVVTYIDRRSNPDKPHYFIAWDLNTSGQFSSVSGTYLLHDGDMKMGIGVAATYLNDNKDIDLVFYMTTLDGDTFHRIAWDMNTNGEVTAMSADYPHHILVGNTVGARSANNSFNSIRAHSLDFADLNNDGIQEAIYYQLPQHSRGRYRTGPAFWNKPGWSNWGGMIGHGWRSSIAMRLIHVNDHHPSRNRILIETASGTQAYVYQADRNRFESPIPGDNTLVYATNQDPNNTSTATGFIAIAPNGIRTLFTERIYEESVPQPRESGPFEIDAYAVTQIIDPNNNANTIHYETYWPDHATYAGMYDLTIGKAAEWTTLENRLDNNATARAYYKRPTRLTDAVNREIQFVYNNTCGGRCEDSKQILKGLRHKNQAGTWITTRYGYDSDQHLNAVQLGNLPAKSYGYHDYQPGFVETRTERRSFTPDLRKDFFTGVLYVGEYNSSITYFTKPVWPLYGKLLNTRNLSQGGRITYQYGDNLQRILYEVTNGIHNEFILNESHPVVFEKTIYDQNTLQTKHRIIYSGYTHTNRGFQHHGSPPDFALTANLSNRATQSSNTHYLFTKHTHPHTPGYALDNQGDRTFRWANVYSHNGQRIQRHEFQQNRKVYSKLFTPRDLNLFRETFWTYDDNQNRLTQLRKRVNGTQTETLSYTYDSFNRPITVVTQIDNGMNRRHTSTSIYAAPGNLNQLHKKTSIQTVLYEDTPPPPAGTASLAVLNEKVNAKRFSYNVQGQVTETSITNQYISSGSTPVTGINRKTYTYDQYGRPTQITAHDGPNGSTQQRFSYQYNNNGYTITSSTGGGDTPEKTQTLLLDPHTLLPLRKTSINGHNSTFTYDQYGRRTQTQDPSGTISSTSYANNLRSIQQQLGNRRVTTHIDGLGRTTYIDNPNGEEDIKYTYHPEGNLHQSFTGNYPSNWTLENTYRYDVFGRPIQQDNRILGTTRTAYNDNTRITTTTDPLGRVSHVHQNLLGQNTQTHFVPTNKRTQTQYDLRGNPTQSTDPKGLIHRNLYDDFSRLTQSYHPSGGIAAVMTYFNDGTLNTTALRSRDGSTYKTLRSTFDAENRVTGIMQNETQVERITYDTGGSNTLGRIASAQNLEQNVNTNYNYDNKGRIIQESTSLPDHSKTYSIQYTYTPFDSYNSITYDDGNQQAFSYHPNTQRLTQLAYVDNNNRLAQSSRTSTENTNPISTYTYNNNGSINSITLGNGVILQYTYTQNNSFLTAITATSPSGQQLYNQQYTYNNIGMITATRFNDPISNTPLGKSYTHNPNNELTNVNLTQFRPDGSVSQNTQNYYTYAYDQNGNATTFSHISPSGPKSTNRNIATLSNELTSQTYPALNLRINLTYDHDGNIAQKSSSLINGATSANDSILSLTHPYTFSYTYNYQGQLKQVLKNNTQAATFLYNHKGERVSSFINPNHPSLPQGASTGRKFYYWNLSGQLIGEAHQSQNHAVRYLYNGNEKIAMIRPNSAGQEELFYFINNLQGTPVHILDAQGNKVANFRVDDWGNPADASLATHPEFNFTGKKYDPVTGLFYFNQRYYDPQIGRFLSHDPAGQFHSPYVYAGNNPTMFIDPDGEWADLLIRAAVFAAGYLADEHNRKQEGRSKNNSSVGIGFGTNGIFIYDGATGHNSLEGVDIGGHSPSSPYPDDQSYLNHEFAFAEGLFDGPMGGNGKSNNSTPHSILNNSNRDVFAIESGTIYKVGWQNPQNHGEGFGYRIWTRNKKYDIFYGHMSPEETHVKAGSIVLRGQYLGKYADPTNGHSTAPHVHIGRRTIGTVDDWVFPGIISPLHGGHITSEFLQLRLIHGKPNLHKGIDYAY